MVAFDLNRLRPDGYQHLVIQFLRNRLQRRFQFPEIDYYAFLAFGTVDLGVYGVGVPVEAPAEIVVRDYVRRRKGDVRLPAVYKEVVHEMESDGGIKLLPCFPPRQPFYSNSDSTPWQDPKSSLSSAAIVVNLLLAPSHNAFASSQP